MEYKIVKSKAQDKARKSFNYQCKRASDCRHSKYMVSCNCCFENDRCDIQKLIIKAKEAM